MIRKFPVNATLNYVILGILPQIPLANLLKESIPFLGLIFTLELCGMRTLNFVHRKNTPESY